ncbi:ribonuclease T1 [Kitasatospora sp. GP30]|uniref:ribonuclease domain-containing protein n=1 Tax=Kitasatospora sp. GP30 TaxID=3035084 RepID=UPI000C70B381|nr:ribonuclease domain-containing protein [Kitasatospora sp. GP30]MDH6140278.1 ribonuclease T1 [Kitasatospora sp. GP30]
MPPTVSRRLRAARSVLAAVLLALSTTGVPARAAAPAAAVRELRPPLPVADLPSQVGQACRLWRDQLHWPATVDPVDYRLPDGWHLRGGNGYHDRDGELPSGDGYHEYDVNPRPTATTHRDAERLVRDAATGQAWYSADHYADFTEIADGC